MALKDLFALVDDKLKDVFHKVSYDPARDRDALTKRIDATKEKFLATEPPRGRKDFSVKNNVVEYRPTVGGNPLVLEGREASYIPAERFAQFLDLLRAEVSEGRLDKEITAAAEGNSNANLTGEAKPARTRKPRSDAGSGRSGWTEDRRKRFEESIAARKAAKAAQA